MNTQKTKKYRSQKGNILVLFAVILGLGVGATMTVFPQLVRSTSLSRKHLAATLEVQNGIEYARAETLSVMRQFKISSNELRRSLGAALVNKASDRPNTWQATMTRDHTPAGAPSTVVSRTIAVTADIPLPSANYLQQRISINESTGAKPVLRTSVARLRLGVNSVFSNAITGNRLTCVFCHAHIYGDVGEYWDHEAGPGHNYPNDRVHGTWYSAGKYIFDPKFDGALNIVAGVGPNLPTRDQKVLPDLDTLYIDKPLNKAMFSQHVRGFQANYQGAQLPWNAQRAKQMLPKFDPNLALVTARGNLSGGTIYTVPYGKGPAAPQLTNSPITKIFNGNVILDGRRTPLKIDGRVFIRGDVILLGQVTGKGTLMSGRNIYVAGDITYMNAPKLTSGQTLFDGSQASNQLLDFVSPNAAAMAANLKGDQLALFATNNIVIGTPYAYSADLPAGRKAVPTVMKFTDSVLMPSYVGQLATDLTTGYMLDAEPLGPSQMGFLFPWSKTGHYLPASRIHKSSVRAYSSPGNAPSDQEYYLDSLGYASHPYQRELWYPMNANGYMLTDWITEANFQKFTEDKTYLDAMNKQDGSGRREQFRQFSLPLFSESPYNANHWKTGFEKAQGADTEGVLATLDRITGLVGQLGGRTVAITDPATGATTTMTVAAGIQTMFDKCVALLAPATSGRNRMSTDLPLGKSSFFGGPLTPNQGVCDFFYWAPSPWNASSAFISVSSSPVNFDPPNGPNPPNPLTRFADLSIKFTFNFTADDPGYQISIGSYYWDPAKVPVRNKVARIDAFLFANHFLALTNDSYVDNQMEINGGVASKDILGNFYDIPGKLSPKTSFVQVDDNEIVPNVTFKELMPPFPAPPSLMAAPSATFQILPGVIVRLDPRAQFDFDLLYQDFGTAESVN